MAQAMTDCKNLVLAGSPGVGKTTLIKEVVLPFKGRVGGFITEELLEDGRRLGFLLRTFDGREGVLASKSLASPHRLNKYGIDMRVLEDLGVESLRRAQEEKELIVVDEIGSMEIVSEAFRRAVLDCLAGRRPVLATIRRGSQPFTDSIERLEDTSLMELTRGNYAEVKTEVRAWLSERLP